MNSPRLITLIAPATVCLQTTLLQQALSQWSLTNHDSLVVIDQAQYPVGCIQFSRWLRALYQKESPEAVHSLCLLKVNPPLSQLPLSFLEPIVCLSSDLELWDLPNQFHRVNSQAPCHYAVVNPDRQFLGLLDTKQLLRYALEDQWGDRTELIETENTAIALESRYHACAIDPSLSSKAISTSEHSPPGSEAVDFQLQTLMSRMTQLGNENQKKDQILAYISHALKTPITGILGLSNLLQNQTQSPLNLRQQQYVDLIHQGGTKLRMMIDDVMNWTQLELEQVNLNRSPIDAAYLCDRSLSSFQDLTRHLPKVSPLTIIQNPIASPVMADEFWLRYMVNRLLAYNLWMSGDLATDDRYYSNHLQFQVQSQGSFWVSVQITNRDLITPVNLTPWISTSLSSSGIASSSSWELGLVVVARLAQLHGGDLICSTTSDRGSDFTLLLPSELLHPDREIANTSFPEKLTILYLSVGAPQTGGDRDWMKRCHTLKGGDCRLLEADDLEQAELLSKVWNPHILVFNGSNFEDIHTYFNRLRESESLCRLPLVTLSQSTTEIANQIPELSVYPCLVSPDSELAASTLLQVIKIAASQSINY